LFGGSKVEILLDGQEGRKTLDIVTDKGTSTLPVYFAEDVVKGKVMVRTKAGKKVEHQGVRIDFIGQIGTLVMIFCVFSLHFGPYYMMAVFVKSTELFYDRGNHYQFLSLTSELAPAGILEGDKEYEFEFPSAEKTSESYNGINARLRCVKGR
jgi:vacuolar protein sorting-associated protein 26